jgi:diguanylate cyclase (GGDEF)-like protein
MDDRNTILKAINIGINFFVPKPLDIEQLLEIIDNAQNMLLAKRKQKNHYEAKISQLSVMAYNDPLTNIPNRSHFQNKLQEIFQNPLQEQYTLMYIDLDNFKSINDLHGHSIGDAILIHFASILQEVLQPHAIVIARLSGDEFAAILKEHKEEKLKTVAQKLLEESSKPIDFDTETLIKISCSVGITSFPVATTTPQNILHITDLAMYEAKKKGKNTFFLQNITQ